jgi:hypothetical protein
MRFLLIAIASLAVLTPINAQAQAVTKFDGTYAGVSETVSGTKDCNATRAVPMPLVITNGIAKFGVTHEGQVNAQGDMQMTDRAAQVLTGKIDSTGRAIGHQASTGGHCQHEYIWKKQ